MKAIQVHEYGGPEVLRYEDVPVPEPGPNEARVKLEAIGLNYIDVYYRTGLYQSALPFTPGMEGAGVIDRIGPAENTYGLQVGDRVTYAMCLGAYAEYAIVPLRLLVKLPAGIDAKMGAALTLQGLTAHYLTHSTFPLKPGQTVLLHAAGGGLGLLVTQVAKRLGATVYGTASTVEKAQLARDAGADEVILYTQVDFVAEVKRLTAGQGVDVVYDSVGKDTFEKSLACLKPRGYLVLCGQSSGPVPPVDLRVLARGSLFVTRPVLTDYLARREELEQRANDLFRWVTSGELKVRVGAELPLREAAEAHCRLQDRTRIGKLLLIP